MHLAEKGGRAACVPPITGAALPRAQKPRFVFGWDRCSFRKLLPLCFLRSDMGGRSFNGHQLLTGPWLRGASLAFLQSQLKRGLNLAFV